MDPMLADLLCLALAAGAFAALWLVLEGLDRV